MQRKITGRSLSAAELETTSLRVALAEQRRPQLSNLADDRPAEPESLAAQMTGERDIRDVRRIFFQMLRQVLAPSRRAPPAFSRTASALAMDAKNRTAGARGASSRIACALVPPMPSEVTPARRGLPLLSQSRSLLFT